MIIQRRMSYGEHCFKLNSNSLDKNRDSRMHLNIISGLIAKFYIVEWDSCDFKPLREARVNLSRIAIAIPSPVGCETTTTSNPS